MRKNNKQHDYLATFGPNTKQWWLYDEDTDEYCDPPIAVLEEVEMCGSYNTIEGMDAMRDCLEDIVSTNPDWLYDEGYRYPAEITEI